MVIDQSAGREEEDKRERERRRGVGEREKRMVEEEEERLVQSRRERQRQRVISYTERRFGAEKDIKRERERERALVLYRVCTKERISDGPSSNTPRYHTYTPGVQNQADLTVIHGSLPATRQSQYALVPFGLTRGLWGSPFERRTERMYRITTIHLSTYILCIYI